MDTSNYKFSRIGACCKECTERYVGCHSSCEKYIDAKSKYDAHKQEIYEAQRLYNIYESHHYKRVAKSKRKQDGK